MKKNLLVGVFTLSLLSVMSSCTNNGGNNQQADNLNPATINVMPTGQVDLSTLSDSTKVASHMAQNPQRWTAALDYLANTSLDTLAVGEYDILPNREVYAIVSEYTPKEEKACFFEAHKRYIDLQYIVSGNEKMGVTHDSNLHSTAPYSDEKDIEFFEPDSVNAEYLVATPAQYFVFLPDDVHRPSMRCDGDSTTVVKKVVLKIKY